MENHGPPHHTSTFYERRRGGVTDWICLSKCEAYKPLGGRYDDRFVPRVPGHKHVWEKGWNDHGGMNVATHEVDICIATCGKVVGEEPPFPVRHGHFARWKRWCAYCSIHSASDANTCRRCRNTFPEDPRDEKLPRVLDDP
jgi:hypothetical protein